MKTTAFAVLAALGACAINAAHDHDHDHDHNHHGHGQAHVHEHTEACAGGHRHEQGGRPHGLSVEISEAAARNSGIETVHPRKRSAGSEFSFKGRFELVPEARETIASPVAGRMELKTRSLRAVRKGETLFTVTSPDIVSRTSEIEILEKRIAVYREIKTPNAELENRLSFKKAELSALLMGHEAKNGMIEVKAPKAGLVEDILELNGTWLDTGRSVLKLTDTTQLRFRGLVAADAAKNLKDGMAADVDGVRGAVRLGVGEASGLVPAYVVFDKPPRAVAGLRGVATAVVGGGGKTETTVPDSAIVEMNLAKYVFVKDANEKNRFVAVEVSTGGKSGGWTAVTGLPEGHCEVVSKGAYELKLATATSGKNTAGHFHADGTFHEGDH